MAYNRALLGGASFVLSTLSSAGVNYQWIQLPAACQDAIRLKQADVIARVCPLGFDNNSLAGLILVGGVLITLVIVMNPLFDFAKKVIKGETI